MEAQEHQTSLANNTIISESSETNSKEVNVVSVACQTEPNLIDKLIDNHVRKQLDDVDLYQEYVRSAQCAQFWPLDKNPIRSLVPSMVKVDLPEQHLKNESLMFDLVQAITNNSKLVNLIAKYIHHIVPNVIISKRIDLIPLITCTIRVCRDTKEQERLISLLFNLIKRPNEEQRRMILSGIIVVLQVSPHQNSSLLLPNLWDHVNDKFPERRILLAESCASLAHYVRPALRTNLILSILIQLLKDKNAAVRSAACRSFACLLTLIMDRNDEVFDACLSATEDIIHDVLKQTPVSFCEHRYELEQMRFCALETVYPLLCMWSVKLNRFRKEIAEFYLSKAQKYFNNLLNHNNTGSGPSSPEVLSPSDQASNHKELTKATAAAAVAKRRSVFFESRNKLNSNSIDGAPVPGSNMHSFFGARRQSAFVTSSSGIANDSLQNNSAMITAQKAISAYLKMLNYLITFVFSDSVHSCAWLSKSNLNFPSDSDTCDSRPIIDSNNSCDRLRPNKLDIYTPSRDNPLNSENKSTANNINGNSNVNVDTEKDSNQCFSHQNLSQISNNSDSNSLVQLFDRPLKFTNRLLDPTLIIDETAIVAFHDQLEQEHMIESLEWILKQFLPRFLNVISYLSHPKFYNIVLGNTNDSINQEFLLSSITSMRQICLLFGKHMTRTKIRPAIKDFMASHNNLPCLTTLYLTSLTSFEPIEQQEFEEIICCISKSLNFSGLTRNDVELLGSSIKIIATNSDQIQSPSTRQKFITYILDALVTYSIKNLNTGVQTQGSLRLDSMKGQDFGAKRNLVNALRSGGNSKSNTKSDQFLQTQTKEFILIIFRHILTCLVDQSVRPTDWAHILVTKFLPLLISLANDSTDVYVCTYARLMCAQLVETFDNYLNSPKLTKQTLDATLPALNSLKGLTEQIKASNLKRQIECLTQDLNEKFFKEDENNNEPITTYQQ